MEHHGSRNGHDGLDGPFGDTIVMVGADSSILGDLGELGEMFTIFGAGECGGIVAEVFGDDDSKIARGLLRCLRYPLKGFLLLLLISPSRRRRRWDGPTGIRNIKQLLDAIRKTK